MNLCIEWTVLSPVLFRVRINDAHPERAWGVQPKFWTVFFYPSFPVPSITFKHEGAELEVVRPLSVYLWFWIFYSTHNM